MKNTNNREQTVTQYVPYAYQLDDNTCRTIDADLTRTIRVSGVPFETLEKAQLREYTHAWVNAISTLGAKNTRVALWTHIIRRKLKYDLSSIEYDNYFSNFVNKQLAARFAKKDFWTNELFISPVYRLNSSDIENFASKFSRDAARREQELRETEFEIDRITSQLMTSLRRYHPTLLGTTESADGMIDSELGHFYSRLLNGGESGPVALNNRSIRHAIQRSDITFEGDIIIIDRPASTKYAAILGIAVPYSIDQVDATVLHDLLRIPFEFILSQSLTFMAYRKAEKLLNDQRIQIESTTANEDQIKELKNAIRNLQNGKFGMGEHEFVLTIFGDSIEEVNKGVEEAQAAFEQKSLKVYRENRSTLMTGYFGMLPGNFVTKRPRRAPISTDNFARFFPMHNFATGNASGSQWGMPLAMFETTSGAPYFVNYHVSRKTLEEQGMILEYEHDEDKEDDDEDVFDEELPQDGELSEQEALDAAILKKTKEQRKESGNYLVIGMNGSGKTLLQALIRTLTRKKKPYMIGKRPYKSFLFDNDQGQKIAINALGGRYFDFELGHDTGIAPFKGLADTQTNRMFLLRLAKWCASKDESYKATATDENTLAKAIEGVYALPADQRRWARMTDLLEAGSPLADAMSRWVNDGAYAWVLDNDEDRFDLENANDFGFDMTSFLSDDYSRTPILMYLKYRIDQVAPGSPHTIDIDEATRALADPVLCSDIVDNEARRIRKKIGVIGLSVQNASDVTTGPLKAVLSNQFPTRFIFPNSSASREDYIDGLKLTEEEYQQVRRGMVGKPGTFLIKKGAESAVVSADLSGLNDIISVLSGSADNIPLVDALIEEYSSDPAKWLPEFFKRRM